MSDNISVSPQSLWRNAALRPYLGEIKRRHGIVDTLALPNMRDLPPLRIEKLFIQPLLGSAPHIGSDKIAINELRTDEGKTLLALFQVQSRFVILGDPGTGKTTLANWLAWRLSSGLSAPLPSSLEDRIPIPCVLREMGHQLFNEHTTVEDLALHVAEHLLGEKPAENLRSALHELIRAKKYVLILDGIDEIPLKNRHHVARWVKQSAMDGASLLATSRVVGYEDFPVHQWTFDSSNPVWEGRNSTSITLDHFKPKRSVQALYGFHKTDVIGGAEYSEILKKYTKSPISLEGEISIEIKDWAEVHYLLPFDESRIAMFVENWYLQRCPSENEARKRRDDLLAALNQSSVTRELARTPNLLSLMAIVHRERAHLPDGKALLYKEISNAYINTIDQHRKIAAGDVLAPYSVEAREGWIAYIGFQFQLQRLTHNQNEHAGVLADEATVIKWLEEAMTLSGLTEPEAVASEFLRWVARRCGLLLPRGEGRYAFVHLSFQEYFCARYIASRVVSPAFVRNRATADQTVSDVKLREWALSPAWQESLVYLFELISGERGPDWVEDIASIVFNPIEDFSNEIVFSAARILIDRHIHLSAERRRAIAESSAWKAVVEMRNLVSTGDGTIFRAFLLSGFGMAYIGGEEIPFFKEVPTLRNPNFDVGNACADQFVLFARGSEVTDIGPLATMLNLKGIDLSRTGVSNVSPIQYLKKLDYLNLEGTPVNDFSFIKGASTLKDLNIVGTRPKSLTFLNSLKQLQLLDVSDVGMKRIPNFSHLADLRWLVADRNPFVNVDNFSKLNNLIILSINDTAVNDLGPLSIMNNLLFLNADRTKIETISKLPPSLRWLTVSDTAVSEIKCLEALESIEAFIAMRTKISELGPLRNAKHLNYLDVSYTQVADVEALSGLHTLERLDLSHTKVRDLSPLKGLTNLRDLRIIGIDAQVEVLANLPNIKIVK